MLQEYGLIISDYDSYGNFTESMARNRKVSVPIYYLNKPWAFVPKPDTTPPSEFRLHGVAATRSGLELMSVVDKQPNEQYTADLKSFLDKKGLLLEKVTI